MRRLFHSWERRLAEREKDRRVLPFDWGTGYLGDGALAGADAESFLYRHVEMVLGASDAYFQPVEASDFRLQGSCLSFTSPLATPYPENNTVFADFFPAPRGRRAVLVLPQWNARSGQASLCRLLNRFGLTALRLSLPYHERRMPPGMTRADYFVSPNLGRTLQAGRQAVLDARSAVSWLEKEGFGPIGILGTSLGSCIAFIAFAHDLRLRAAVFNHVSTYFADVVWRGLSTRHVREGLAGHIGLEELRRLWLPISPRSYFDRLRETDRKLLLVYALYDLSFPPDLSRQVVEDLDRLRVPYRAVAFPCGHYSSGKFPFNLLNGLAMAAFLSRNL